MALQIKTIQLNRLLPLHRFIHTNIGNYGKYCAEKNLKQCYRVLGIPEDSDQEKIRSAYLKLVKKFHPDSKTADADPAKFQEIDKAFRILLHKQSKDRWGIEEIKVDDVTEEYDIKHQPPQHRQYLSYAGYGHGTVFERQKQFGKIRAVHAAERVMNHRLKKLQATDDALMEKKTQTHKIKTKYGFDRIVEDLIQDAMAKGDFNNLKGSGKPLPCITSSNPYVDFVTQKLNEVLIDNGFTPEWIMLQKEIREEKKQLKRSLYKDRTHFGENPLTDIDEYKWQHTVKKYEKTATDINKKIEKYNLMVPTLQTQVLFFNLQKEAEKICKYGQTCQDVAYTHKKEKVEAQTNPQNIMSFVESFLMRNKKY